jgi:hypothetical protein
MAEFMWFKMKYENEETKKEKRKKGRKTNSMKKG